MKKLILFLAAVCCAAMMQAETVNNVKYIDENGVEQTVDATVVTTASGPVTLGRAGTATWYVVTGTDVTIWMYGVICSGNVNLILMDGAQLTVTATADETAGIQVSGEGNSLTIYGQANQTGILKATGGFYAAGIGGGDFGSGSNITINGGTITATGGVMGAGIGGGHRGAGSNITINGGIVTANGNNGGAGIGSGCDGGTPSNIFVADGVNVAANGSVITHTSSGDIAVNLAGKGSVTAFDLAPLLKAIEDAVGGSEDETIKGIANTAKASILVQATADGAKAVSDLAVAKINALKVILSLIGDDTNVLNTTFISNIINSIASAVSVNEVTTKKTQAVNEILAFLNGFSSGKTAAFGTMGTKQDGPAIEVTDQDNNSIILYNPKKVNFINLRRDCSVLKDGSLQ